MAIHIIPTYSIGILQLFKQFGIKYTFDSSLSYIFLTSRVNVHLLINDPHQNTEPLFLRIRLA